MAVLINLTPQATNFRPICSVSPVTLVGLVVTLIAGMTGTAFILERPEVVAGEAELSPKSIDVSGASEAKVITGKNRQTQITIPGIWSDADRSWRNRDAIIHVGNELREEALSVDRLDKAKAPAFRRFHRGSVDYLKKEFNLALVEPPRELDIDGLPAMQYWLAKPDQLDEDLFVYVNGRKAYYLIIAVGIGNKRAMAAATVNSFREITDNA